MPFSMVDFLSSIKVFSYVYVCFGIFLMKRKYIIIARNNFSYEKTLNGRIKK